LLSEVACDIGVNKGLLGKVIHADTTTLSYYGYREDDGVEDISTITKSAVSPHGKPMHGYAKNKHFTFDNDRES
jgi:hypothetical protein